MGFDTIEIKLFSYFVVWKRNICLHNLVVFLSVLINPLYVYGNITT